MKSATHQHILGRGGLARRTQLIARMFKFVGSVLVVLHFGLLCMPKLYGKDDRLLGTWNMVGFSFLNSARPETNSISGQFAFYTNGRFSSVFISKGTTNPNSGTYVLQPRKVIQFISPGQTNLTAYDFRNGFLVMRSISSTNKVVPYFFYTHSGERN
jgi:hypothetical protein